MSVKVKVLRLDASVPPGTTASGANSPLTQQRLGGTPGQRARAALAGSQRFSMGGSGPSQAGPATARSSSCGALVQVTPSAPRTLGSAGSVSLSTPTDTPVHPQANVDSSRKSLDARTWMPAPAVSSVATPRGAVERESVKAEVEGQRGELTSMLDDVRRELGQLQERHESSFSRLLMAKDEQRQNVDAMQNTVVELRRALESEQQHFREYRQELDAAVSSTHSELAAQRQHQEKLEAVVATQAAALQRQREETQTPRLDEQPLQLQPLQPPPQPQQQWSPTQQSSRSPRSSTADALPAAVAAAAAEAAAGRDERWHQELEQLRADQQAALKEQARLLRQEFEAAYRAEQLANGLMKHVAVLEQNLVSVQEERQFAALERRLGALESDWGQEAGTLRARCLELSTRTERDAENAAQLRRQVEEVAGAVARQVERLGVVEQELTRQRSRQDHRLEALETECGKEIHGATAVGRASGTLEVAGVVRSTAVPLWQQVEHLAGLVARHTERLGRVEHELASQGSVSEGQLATALARSERVAEGLVQQELSRQLSEALASTRSSMEARCQECTDRVTAEYTTWLREAGRHRAETEAAAEAASEGRDECRELALAQAQLVQELAALGRSNSEQGEELGQRFAAELEAEARNRDCYNARLADAVAAIKSNFEACSDVVSAMRAELSELTRVAESERSARRAVSAQQQAELAQVIDVTCSAITSHSDEAGAAELQLSRLAEWCRTGGGLLGNGSESAVQDVGVYTMDVAMVCRLVQEVVGLCDRLHRRFAAECAGCRRDATQVGERVDDMHRRLAEASRAWERETAGLHRHIATIGGSGAVSIADLEPDEHHNGGAAVAAHHMAVARAPAAAEELLTRVVRLEARLHNLGSPEAKGVTSPGAIGGTPPAATSTESPGGTAMGMAAMLAAGTQGWPTAGKLQARRSMLLAVDSMEAAARKVAAAGAGAAAAVERPVTP